MNQTRSLSCAIFLVAASLWAPAVNAQSADDLTAGLRLFTQKGDCGACHGWAGDGRKLDSQMPDGANLRGMQIDRESLTITLKFGRPGTGLPPFDRLALTPRRRLGLKSSTLR